MVNPLTAPTPVAPIEPSPYYPSSRRFRNPLFLRIEEVPGWDDLRRRPARPPGQRGPRAQRRPPHRPRRDLPAQAGGAGGALRAAFAATSASTGICAGQGQALTDFATYCALAERHGKDWRSWPAGYRRPDGADVARFRDDNQPRASASTPGSQWLHRRPAGARVARDRRRPRPADRPRRRRAPTPGAGRI